MKKYLFDKNDFDDEKSGEKVFYTEEQIVMAKTQSYAQGKVDGFNEAQQSQNEQLLKITESLTQKCAGLTASEDRRETDKFDSAAKIAMQIVQKLMPKLSEQFSLHEIEGVITTALETRQDEPRIAITLPTQHLDALKPRIDELAIEKGYAGKVILLADDALAPSDCRIEWADGGAERNYERIFNQIDTEITKALSALPTDKQSDV